MTINKTQFEKGLQGLRKLSMTPREKGEVFHKLHLYTEARPVPATSDIFAAVARFFKKSFLFVK
ncbi:hypothetical protein KW796_00565 [Candidatus Parcubacteria bacterium]|nr:hypothetical protein [Candidatus Parcubacteria bacterium]